MLSHEDGVFSHRRLLTVVGRVGGREPLVDEVGRVRQDHVHALAIQILSLRRLEAGTAAECRSLKAFKDLVEVSHGGGCFTTLGPPFTSSG